jgi:hypothetical protein
MEDVLDVYKRPQRETHPLVCMDESSKQQIKEIRTPWPVESGQPQKYDSEYERNGVSNLFLFLAPLLGWRHVKVTDQRTRVDWAHAMKEAEHGRNRIQRPSTPVPGSSYTRPTVVNQCGGRVANRTQQKTNSDQLAIHNGRCQNQTQKTLPWNTKRTEY